MIHGVMNNMKEFEIVFIETVYFKTTVEAKSEDEARLVFMEGNWNDCEEVFREFVEMDSIEEIL